MFSVISIGYVLAALICYLLAVFIDAGSSMELNFVRLDIDHTIIIFLKIIIAFVAGTTLVDCASHKFWKFPKHAFVKTDKVLNLVTRNANSISMINIMLIAYLFLYWGDAVWIRSYYHLSETFGGESEAASSYFDLFLSLLELTCGTLPAFVRYCLKNPSFKAITICRINLLFVMCFLYGAGTKICVVAYVLYLAAGLLNKSRKWSFQRVGLFVPALLILAVIIEQRSFGIYGISTFIASCFNLMDNSSESIVNALQIVGSSVLITAESAVDAVPSYEYLLVELSPLSGFNSGWYQIFDVRRLSFAVPYSALGTLDAYSIYFVFVYGAFYSLVINWFRRVMFCYLGEREKIISVVLCLFVVSVAFMYNLRSLNRYVYYISALSFVLTLLIKLRPQSINNR